MNALKFTIPVILVLGILLALRLFGVFEVNTEATQSQVQQSDLIAYTDEKLGFSVNHPKDWSVIQSSEGYVIIGNSADDCLISVMSTASQLSLAVDVELWTKSIKNRNTVKILESKVMTGQWSYYISWEDNSSGISDSKLFNETYIAKTKNKTYNLNTTAPRSKYADYPFPEIIKSFKILGQ